MNLDSFNDLGPEVDLQVWRWIIFIGVRECASVKVNGIAGNETLEGTRLLSTVKGHRRRVRCGFHLKNLNWFTSVGFNLDRNGWTEVRTGEGAGNFWLPRGVTENDGVNLYIIGIKDGDNGGRHTSHTIIWVVRAPTPTILNDYGVDDTWSSQINNQVIVAIAISMREGSRITVNRVGSTKLVHVIFEGGRLGCTRGSQKRGTRVCFKFKELEWLSSVELNLDLGGST